MLDPFTDGTDYTITQRMFVFPANTAPGVASRMCATLFSLSHSGTVIITLTSSTSVLIIDSVFAVTTVTITLMVIFYMCDSLSVC